jgi:hypothetical protein
MKKHPIQPLEDDGKGVLRFKKNKIVEFLLAQGPADLNKLAVMNFPRDDRRQFAQLIGYSLGGFGELSYVTDEEWGAAASMGQDPTLSEKDARIKALEETLAELRAKVSQAVEALDGISGDDL